MKFKNRKEIDEYFKGDKIKCLICGGYLKSLAKHLVYKHGITAAKYKKEFGLPWGRGLTADDTKFKASLIMTDRNKKDPRMKMTAETMRKAQQAKKRPIMPYRINELSSKALEMTDEAKRKSVCYANKILDMMEKEMLPSCYSCLFDLPDLYNLYGAVRHNKETKKRYKAIKNKIPSLIELKTGLNKDKLINEIKRMSKEGATNKDIAKYFYINEKTVADYLKEKHQHPN